MNSELHEHVLRALRRRNLLAPGQRLGVAVSGGADSVALFLLLSDLRADLGLVLSVVHLNHQLRGPDADADEQFVKALAGRAGVELHLRRIDVAAEARRNRWNLEDAGRRLRLGFIEDLVADGRVDRVAVAHTADDQAETVLAHLLRGTGPGGLAGIHPVAGPVIRPLLSVRREELRSFLTARGQAWREDATNQDESRLRARLRGRLIPLLEKDYQPALVERLGSLAELAGSEEEFWESLLAPHMLNVERSEGEVSLPASALGGVHRALGRRLVRGLVGEVSSGGAGPAALHVERVLELAATGHSGQKIELPGRVTVERTPNRRLRFRLSAGETKPAAAPYAYDVAWPLRESASVQVGELGSRFRLKLIDWPPRASETKAGLVPLDAGLLAPPLVLRSWRPGDAYQPAGRHRVYKLKDLFYRAKVEACQRQQWPVLTSGGRVVWTRDFPPASALAAGAQTRKGLLIVEERIEG